MKTLRLWESFIHFHLIYNSDISASPGCDHSTGFHPDRASFRWGRMRGDLSLALENDCPPWGDCRKL